MGLRSGCQTRSIPCKAIEMEGHDSKSYGFEHLRSLQIYREVGRQSCHFIGLKCWETFCIGRRTEGGWAIQDSDLITSLSRWGLDGDLFIERIGRVTGWGPVVVFNPHASCIVPMRWKLEEGEVLLNVPKLPTEFHVWVVFKILKLQA